MSNDATLGGIVPLETVDDIIESLADKLGIYGVHGEPTLNDQCECRRCWTSELRLRLRAAIELDRKLNAPVDPAKPFEL